MGVGFIVKAKNFHRRARRERREIKKIKIDEIIENQKYPPLP
jgi:hypothetical protein